MSFVNLRTVYLRICTFIIFFPSFLQSVSLDQAGHYKLVVAIDERTAQNSVTEYVENIKKGVQDLSQVLYSSTNSKFSIQEVDIVIPSHWNTPFDSIAATQHYTDADIKISHTYYAPSVNNANPCGRSGGAILLPYNFFDDLENSIFGNVGKALLTQFVRFRYGAWEEHGYPGDSMFPYFWKGLSEPDWEVNVCTNSPISGNFKNIEDERDCSPTSGDEYPPISECRFIPSGQQTATSSLMGYHYLETVEKFCDSQTHNKQRPTPQNFFCRYQSIMEVIQSSNDWIQTTQPNNPISVEFKVVKNSAPSLLYILLDSGLSPAPSSTLSEIAAVLGSFVEDPALENAVAAVGKYSGDNVGELLTEIVPWNSFKDGQEQFIDAFNNTFGRKPGFRDFGGGLKEVVGIAAQREHSKGVVVLIVKTGIETNTAAITPESDVFTQALLSKVKIFSVELQGSDIQPANNLERVSLQSGGSYLSLKSSDFNQELGDFLLNIKTEILTDIGSATNLVFARRDIIPKDELVQFKVNTRLSKFEAFLIPLSGTIANPRFASTSGDAHPDIVFTEMQQWGTSSTSNTAKVFHYSGTATFMRDRLYWNTFDYTCVEGDCQVLVYAFALPEDITAIPSVTLSVSTSAENNVVDMNIENAGSDLGTPFAIYTEIKQDDFPLRSAPGLSVTGYIVNKENSKVYKIELKDDGLAVPDVATNDGIFSGTFVPTFNGPHDIFVTAEYRVPSSTTKLQNDTNILLFLQSSPPTGKLFPIDQIHIGCVHLGCWSQEPSVEFIVSKTLPKSVEFKNVDSYVPMAHRVTDLSVSSMSDFNILLEWTAPGVFTSEGIVNVDSYQIKHSNEFEKLVNDFDNADDLFPPDQLPTPADAGNLQSVTFNFGQEADQYFAIKSTTSHSGTSHVSSISVISGANIRSSVIPTTTSTTTTIRPTTTSTTTLAPPTLNPGSTTGTGVVPTSTIPTSLRTTTERLTTPRSTTPPTTPPKSTPSPFPSTTEIPPKHWFEETEGQIIIAVFGAGVIFIFGLGLAIIILVRRR